MRRYRLWAFRLKTISFAMWNCLVRMCSAAIRLIKHRHIVSVCMHACEGAPSERNRRNFRYRLREGLLRAAFIDEKVLFSVVSASGGVASNERILSPISV